MYKCDDSKYTCAEDPTGKFKSMKDCTAGCIKPTPAPTPPPTPKPTPPPTPVPCATDYIIVETDYSTPGATNCTGSSSATMKYNSGQCSIPAGLPNNSKRFCCNKGGSSVSYVWYGDTKCSSTKMEDSWTEPTGKCKTDKAAECPQSFNCIPKGAPTPKPPPRYVCISDQCVLDGSSRAVSKTVCEQLCG
jgi:hypothetical protein